MAPREDPRPARCPRRIRGGPWTGAVLRTNTGRGAVVEARGWGWRHPGRREWALRGLDLRIEAGERVLLLGASGAGKSTLLRGLAGLLDPSGAGAAEGFLLVDGDDARRARHRSGLVLQDPGTQLVMERAGDDVAFGLENRCVPTAEIWPRVDEALAAVGWRYARDRSTTALSGGEQQRLALAGTAALRPALLLLDEPTANLDPMGAAAVRDLVPALCDRLGATLVLVEHRIDEVVPLVERVVVLAAGGGVAFDGPPYRIFAEHGDELAAGGIWVPGRPIDAPARAGSRSGPELVVADAASFRYPGRQGGGLAATDVVVRGAEALAVVGPNGSGKSTLAGLLGGLLRQSGGTVLAQPALVDGLTVAEPWRWRAAALARRIGSVFQDPEHQFLTGRVRDELILGPMRAGSVREDAERRADELLERLRLGSLGAMNPFTLSGGEQRRLSVATALATAPALVICDEPTFGQDRSTWRELLSLFASIRDDGGGVVVVSHDEPFVDALADRRLQLKAAA